MLAGPAQATPCSAYRRALDPPGTAALAQVVAAQMQVPAVKILDVFQFGSWHMVYVDTHAADEAVLFFPGDPVRHHYSKLWSGAARRTEALALREWARAGIPGLPPGLANCFGWYVTQGRSR